jgi:hypothetical protein
LYRAILRELRSRGVIRTDNAPVGDYAEYLVATTLGGQLAPNSEKAWDVLGDASISIRDQQCRERYVAGRWFLTLGWARSPSPASVEAQTPDVGPERGSAVMGGGRR